MLYTNAGVQTVDANANVQTADAKTGVQAVHTKANVQAVDAKPNVQTPEASIAARMGDVALWVFQIAGAAVFLGFGAAKLLGADMMVAVFETVGLGQWFRYVTGMLEVGGALLLVIPRAAGLGGLILATVMVGAVVAHLLILGGSPAAPIVLLLVTATVAWRRRTGIARVLGTVQRAGVRDVPHDVRALP